MQKANKIEYSDIDNLIAKTNSQMGSLKNYNCRKLILAYANEVLKETGNIIKFNKAKLKFVKLNNN